MTSEELYEHKEAYEEMLPVLKKYKDLPRVATTIWEVERCLGECKRYEHWKINKPNWGYDYGCGLPCDAFLQECEYIDNQKLSSPTTYFVLYFSSEPYIFEDYYPKQLFDEFLAELINQTNPKYVDSLHNKLYYTEDNASNAYEVVRKLYEKYIDTKMKSSEDGLGISKQNLQN